MKIRVTEIKPAAWAGIHRFEDKNTGMPVIPPASRRRLWLEGTREPLRFEIVRNDKGDVIAVLGALNGAIPEYVNFSLLPLDAEKFRLRGPIETLKRRLARFKDIERAIAAAKKTRAEALERLDELSTQLNNFKKNNLPIPVDLEQRFSLAHLRYSHAYKTYESHLEFKEKDKPYLFNYLMLKAKPWHTKKQSAVERFSRRLIASIIRRPASKTRNESAEKQKIARERCRSRRRMFQSFPLNLITPMYSGRTKKG